MTVAIAIYNVEKYLENCLESLYNRTKKEDYEILLMDDGSIDNSSAICKRYIEKGLKAKLINKNNEGLVSVRNLSIELAKGNFIFFSDR